MQGPLFLVPFPELLSFCLFCSIPVCRFLFDLIIEETKGEGSNWERRGRETGRSKEMENCNQDVQCQKQKLDFLKSQKKNKKNKID